MSRTAPIPGRIEETHDAYQIIAPPKEFFRQFANLAHNRVLKEDFPHEKLLTLKYKGTGANFAVNAKGSVNIKSEIKKTEETTADGKKNDVFQTVDTYPTSSEVKFLTAYNKTSTEARFNNKGIVKAWTNWGVHNIGEPIEIISGLKGDTCFNNSKAWVAGYYTRGAIVTGSRVQVRYEKKNYIFSLAEKLAYSNKDLWAGAYVDLNLTDLKVSHCNAIFGYHVNKNIHFYVEHASVKECPKPAASLEKTIEATKTVTEKTVTTEKASGEIAQKTVVTVDTKIEESVPILKRIGFGLGTFTGVYKDANVHALAQVGWEEPTQTFTFEAGAAYTINSTSSVRAKVNQDFDLAIGGRHKINKNISINVGTNIPLQKLDKFYDSHKTVPIPFGSTLEFSF